MGGWVGAWGAHAGRLMRAQGGWRGWNVAGAARQGDGRQAGRQACMHAGWAGPKEPSPPPTHRESARAGVAELAELEGRLAQRGRDALQSGSHALAEAEAAVQVGVGWVACVEGVGGGGGVPSRGLPACWHHTHTCTPPTHPRTRPVPQDALGALLEARWPVSRWPVHVFTGVRACVLKGGAGGVTQGSAC